MIRYSLLRVLIFLGCLAAGWLVGLRGPENQLVLVVGAAVASLVISVVALRRFREDFNTELSARLQRRAARRSLRRDGVDEHAEDREVATVEPPETYR